LLTLRPRLRREPRLDGSTHHCAANADNLVTIPKAWLEARATRLSSEKIEALDTALRFALALE
jgi:mRNA-degrading endonuclease toxin of MazEF toxin-antitoxin module